METKQSSTLDFRLVLLVAFLLVGHVLFCGSDIRTIPTPSDDLGYAIKDIVLPEGYFDNKINAIPVVGCLGELIEERQERRGVFIIVLPLLSASQIWRD